MRIISGIDSKLSDPLQMFTPKVSLNTKALQEVELDLRECFDRLFELQRQLKRTLAQYADGKRLKGHELVG